jgi:hypothetical protein
MTRLLVVALPVALLALGACSYERDTRVSAAPASQTVVVASDPGTVPDSVKDTMTGVGRQP